ncbi:hypothetical protein EMPS_09987 [Entomortierella parvispora]|uniref:Uncharacterized protein n=1 Tax=Entomortierella parvispora TaxID=205924 RepID=A0A9P3HJM1_9FUNG|nr:hypothetical protein EMPS_09987 [Entomortierella parvispora]
MASGLPSPIATAHEWAMDRAAKTSSGPQSPGEVGGSRPEGGQNRPTWSSQSAMGLKDGPQGASIGGIWGSRGRGQQQQSQPQISFLTGEEDEQVGREEKRTPSWTPFPQKGSGVASPARGERSTSRSTT